MIVTSAPSGSCRISSAVSGSPRWLALPKVPGLREPFSSKPLTGRTIPGPGRLAAPAAGRELAPLSLPPLASAAVAVNPVQVRRVRLDLVRRSRLGGGRARGAAVAGRRADLAVAVRLGALRELVRAAQPGQCRPRRFVHEPLPPGVLAPDPPRLPGGRLVARRHVAVVRAAGHVAVAVRVPGYQVAEMAA